MADDEVSPTILFRCDGTSHTGLGHLSRSIALAEALVDVGCECSFIGRYNSVAAERLWSAGLNWETLHASPWSVEDANELTRFAAQRHALGMVLDGYVLDAEYLRRVAAEGPPVLVIDDFAALPQYPCAAVLNFTSRAEFLVYPRGHTRYYLGPRWLLARRALRARRAEGIRPVERARRVLVVAGGNDPHDIVIPATEALLAYDPRICVRVVIGASYAALPALEELLTHFDGDTRLFQQLPDLSSDLTWADLCISSAGLTKYESAYLGTPAGVLSQNEGQAMDAASLEELGVVVNLGPASGINPTRLAQQLRRLAQDRSLRESLQRCCLAVIPPDPTHDLAASLLSEVFRGV